MHGMKKITIDLPDVLRRRVEVIRDAISAAVGSRRIVGPQVPLPGVTLGDPTIAERAGGLLDGFGE